MPDQSLNRLLFHHINFGLTLLKKHDSYPVLIYNVLNRYQSQSSKVENNVEIAASKQPANNVDIAASKQPAMDAASRMPVIAKEENKTRIARDNSEENDLTGDKWNLEPHWLTKALEPALQFWKWALPIGKVNVREPAPSSRSLAEIFASIQRSKLALRDWSLSDFTIGLYLIYLQQASTNPFEDVKGVQISSDLIVQDLIYHTELAKGAYKDSATSLAKYSMLRESNVVKFVKNSSILRPGYYIAIDIRKKLVVLGIRGTHTISDLITDIVSASNKEVTPEGYSTHFGTAESARWFLAHEMGTVKKCLEKHKDFRLRLVGHSLGGATASLLAIMLREKSQKELGFSPDIVTAVGYATPPCVSKQLAESCPDYVTTVVMQDDIIPRLSLGSLARLRNEILQTDWATVFEKEDWRNVVDLVANAKQFASSVQDVARKLADYAKFRNNQTKFSDIPARKESVGPPDVPRAQNPSRAGAVVPKNESAAACIVPDELFVPGTVYYLKRNLDMEGLNHHYGDAKGFFTLWKRHPGEHFQRIFLSNNLISDHKCDSHYYALRDVLKGFPCSQDDSMFR